MNDALDSTDPQYQYHDLDSQLIAFEVWNKGVCVGVNKYFKSGLYFLTYKSYRLLSFMDFVWLRVPKWGEFSIKTDPTREFVDAHLYLDNNWAAIWTAVTGECLDPIMADQQTT